MAELCDANADLNRLWLGTCCTEQSVMHKTGETKPTNLLTACVARQTMTGLG